MSGPRGICQNLGLCCRTPDTAQPGDPGINTFFLSSTSMVYQPRSEIQCTPTRPTLATVSPFSGHHESVVPPGFLRAYCHRGHPGLNQPILLKAHRLKRNTSAGRAPYTFAAVATSTVRSSELTSTATPKPTSL